MTLRRRNFTAALLILAALAGCGVPQRDPPAAPERIAATAQPAGFEDIRFWGDARPAGERKMVAEFKGQILKSGRSNGAIDILALSGGGAEGAYGAGFLAGWTKRGNRPDFDIVTGISTGALIAPFAFLGRSHDGRLKLLFTGTTAFDLVELTPVSALFGGSSLADTGPLLEIIASEMNARIITAIAREHVSGRRLYVGTTNLDAQRPMIWDIGKIAASGKPGAAALIHKIILASASVPGGFPPVMIDVTAGGRSFQEMHVDGGVTQEIFVYPPALPMRRILSEMGLANARKTFWLVHNASLLPQYEAAKPGVINITTRSIRTLLKSQGYANLRQIEGLARRDGFAFRLATLPQSAGIDEKLAFDTEHMTALYDIGSRQALSGSPWVRKLADIERR